MEELKIPRERPFHRAADDAFYTARVLEELYREVGSEAILPYRSIDYYRLPDNRDEEIFERFPGYSKYVSRIFPTKEDAMRDKGVTEMKCYECGRSLRKRVHWFTPNQKVYYGLAICPEHGYLKGKIRLKKVDEIRVFAVRTLKLTDEEGAAKIMGRRENVRKKRAERSRVRRRRRDD